LVYAAIFGTVDDVFYLLVDELDAPVPDVPDLVARRRAEQRRLNTVVPPTMFSGGWQPSSTSSPALTSGDRLRGVGVCGGRVRGRVRIVRPETIDDLQPGEILVAEVTDAGPPPPSLPRRPRTGGSMSPTPWWRASSFMVMPRGQLSCSGALSKSTHHGRFMCSSWPRRQPVVPANDRGR
jgi:hypothetical protein